MADENGGDDAFNRLRELIGEIRACPPELIGHPDELVQMSTVDGLRSWERSATKVGEDVPTEQKMKILGRDDLKTISLWVVREEDVVHAQEDCAFGRTLTRGVVKHTNLTGGAPAFCGGEVVFTGSGEIVVNGASGRYHPRSESEMTAVATAFRKSGYSVWSMGYDADADRPFPFLGKAATWVA